ncbi:FmdB family zinc ribbon protein [Neptuniibacter halophilus]|uniref:FmdB family zinc ribbon protein n=1 Tax=Neptuniibacter halophilus TaxID=651666 RepID=UPI0025738926|nr:zinc ribbon domain-containing protein [Neptuniibacter halophilus]
MPIFDFQCESCGHGFEKLVLKSDAPAPACVACSSNEVIRKISAPGFRLSGSGWYETDFKTGKKKNLASGSDASSGS